MPLLTAQCALRHVLPRSRRPHAAAGLQTRRSCCKEPLLTAALRAPSHRWTLRATLLNHQLPYKQHLLMSLVQLGIYLTHALPHQLAALELYQLHPWVQPACKAVDRAVLAMVPTADLGFGQLCEQQQMAAQLVMVFCYVAIALLFSINFIYWKVGLLAVGWDGMGWDRLGSAGLGWRVAAG
jgi:hypothetical protein